MELFSISCTTCQKRLKVRDASAIGQILICPGCGSMVLVEAPPTAAGGRGAPAGAMLGPLQSAVAAGTLGCATDGNFVRVTAPGSGDPPTMPPVSPRPAPRRTRVTVDLGGSVGPASGVPAEGGPVCRTGPGAAGRSGPVRQTGPTVAYSSPVPESCSSPTARQRRRCRLRHHSPRRRSRGWP